MPDLNMHKIDFKGNIIKEWLPWLRDSTGADEPFGIDTDGDRLWISYGEIGTKINIYEYNKKNQLLYSFTIGSKDQGVTTDRCNLWIGRTSADVTNITKRNLQIRNLAVNMDMRALTMDGMNLLGGEGLAGGSPFIDVNDTRGGTLKNTLTTSENAVGVHSLGNRLLVANPTALTIDYYDRKGNLVKTISPSFSTSTEIRDLCQDEEFIWVIAFKP